MAWLGACSKGVIPLVILDDKTVDPTIYIGKVLLATWKYGNEVFDSDWFFQQDGVTPPHSHHLTQQRCGHNFPSFIVKDHWPPNSPDLNLLDYSIWDELVVTIIVR